MYLVQFKWRQGSTEKTKKWTEQLYVDIDSQASAIPIADQLAALLAPLHGKQSTLTGYRLSDVAKVRAARLRIPGKDAPPVTYGTFDADYPSTGLQIAVVATDGTLVNQTLRGLKDDIIKGGDKVPDPQWDPLFAALKTFIETKTNSVKLWCLDPKADRWIVNSISEAGQVSLPPNNLGDDEKVVITGRGIPKYFRKVWRVQTVNPATIQLRGFRVQNGFVFKDMTADLSRDTKKALPIATFDFIRSTSHKVSKEKN